MLRSCEICGREFDDFKKVNKKICRDAKCRATYNKWNSTPNCKCKVCGREFYIRPSHLEKEGSTCSKECFKKLKREQMMGEKNHQYNIRAEENSSWKGGVIFKQGYKYIYLPSHPFAEGAYVREHRVIAEQFLELNEENSVEIEGVRYIKPSYDVHHKDFNKLNNNPNNLQILTRSEHTTLHNLSSPQERNSTDGRFLKNK